MSDDAPEADRFPVDRVAVAMIVSAGVVLTPGCIFLTVYWLARGVSWSPFAFDLQTAVYLVVAALSLWVGVIALRTTTRELSGALGVRFDARGVTRGRTRLEWSAVEAVETPRHGVLELVAGDERLRLCPYLFADAKAVTALVESKTREFTT